MSGGFAGSGGTGLAEKGEGDGTGFTTGLGVGITFGISPVLEEVGDFETVGSGDSKGLGVTIGFRVTSGFGARVGLGLSTTPGVTVGFEGAIGSGVLRISGDFSRPAGGRTGSFTLRTSGVLMDSGDGAMEGIGDGWGAIGLVVDFTGGRNRFRKLVMVS